MHVGQGFRGTTTRLREDDPRHVELMRQLDDLFAGGAGETVMTPAQLDALSLRTRTPPDPQIEEAGMAAVEAYFAGQPGWETRRVEHENKGWDVEAHGPSGQVFNVEVKATRRPVPLFSISTNELDRGPTLPGSWWLAVVTRATLADQEDLKWYTAEQARAVAIPTDLRMHDGPERGSRVSLSTLPTRMIVATWNMDAKLTREHETFIKSLQADVLLLTEVRAAVQADVLSQGVMTRGQHYAGLRGVEGHAGGPMFTARRCTQRLDIPEFGAALAKHGRRPGEELAGMGSGARLGLA